MTTSVAGRAARTTAKARATRRVLTALIAALIVLTGWTQEASSGSVGADGAPVATTSGSRVYDLTAQHAASHHTAEAWGLGSAQEPRHVSLMSNALGVAAEAGAGGTAKAETSLYQKLSAEGEHLKYGITKNPGTRYTSAEMNGGRLNILASGDKADMLALERGLHEWLPIGPEEGQAFYILKQIANGLRPPPY